jgi:hypothetical protein
VRLYTDKDIKKILTELRIQPITLKEDYKDMVTGEEAARILSWRAKDEYDIDYTYTPTTLRQHTRARKDPKTGEEKPSKMPPEAINTDNKRLTYYNVKAIFKLPISPKRGIRATQKA